MTWRVISARPCLQHSEWSPRVVAAPYYKLGVASHLPCCVHAARGVPCQTQDVVGVPCHALHRGVAAQVEIESRS